MVWMMSMAWYHRCFFLSAATTTAMAVKIMNEGGIPYQISNKPLLSEEQDVEAQIYQTDFEQHPDGAGGAPVEHFDVYGEVQTMYSQVYWTRNEPIALPDALVTRFQNKVMAITGYEVDQVVVQDEEELEATSMAMTSTSTAPRPRRRNVRITPPSSVTGNLGGFACYPDCSDGDVSIPSYHAYNHHYFSWLVNGDHVEVVDAAAADRVAVPNPTRTRIQTKSNINITSNAFPASIVFKENPGGEFRKSYHGYPAGYAQLIASPSHWIVEPMQIDTHNRAYDLTDDTVGHVEWFLPQQFQDKTMTQRNIGLNPLIECPCTNRISKFTRQRSPVLTSGTCAAPMATPQACLTTARDLLVKNYEKIRRIHNANHAPGCLLVPQQAEEATERSGDEVHYQVFWNTASTDVTCGNATVTPLAGRTDLLNGQVRVSIQHEGVGNVTLTLTGPSDVWFGVALGGRSMADQPYALIVEGQGHVTERRLVNHGPGELLKPSIYVSSNTVHDNDKGSVRSVVIERPLVIGPEYFSSKYYSIPKRAGDVNLMAAIGSTTKLSYHAQRTAGGKLALLPTRQAACICAPQNFTYLSYMNSSFEQQYKVDCWDEPRSNMLRHGDGTGRPVANAACNLATYHGGLHCCQHGFFLTDVEQEALIPKDKVDKYYLKWRYYFQEYHQPAVATDSKNKRDEKDIGQNNSLPAAPFVTELSKKTPSHQHLHHWVFLIDAMVNDYEEDNSHYGRASIGRLTARLQAKDMGLEDIPQYPFDAITPIVVTPHCHAPSCIREELWNADTNQILCNVTALYGSERWGSTNTVFNEANYIAIPPCLFGHQPGLQVPFRLSPTTNLLAIKYFNNTYRHLGQMAQWTGLMVYDNSTVENVNGEVEDLQ